LEQHAKKAPANTPMSAEELRKFSIMEEKYREFWRRDTKTGVRL